MSVTLGAIKTPAKSSAGKKDYPIVPVRPEEQEMADELARLSDQEKASKSGKESIQEQLKGVARPFIFETNHGKATLQSTMSIIGLTPAEVRIASLEREIARLQGEIASLQGKTPKATELLVALKDAYITTETLDEILPILGEGRTNEFFRQVFAITVDSKLIPADSQQHVVDKLVGVMQDFNCVDALAAKSGFKPTAAFATMRHHKINVEENLQLEQINGGKGLTIMSVAPARGRR